MEIGEYYDNDDMVTAASERIYSEIKDSTTEEFSDDVTTRVSFETSYDVLSNDPEIVQNAVTSDDINDNNDEGSDKNEDGKMDNYILTKDDFMNNESEDSRSGEIQVARESPDDATEMHHDVLVKLKSDITKGNNWLININNAFRELRKLM